MAIDRSLNTSPFYSYTAARLERAMAELDEPEDEPEVEDNADVREPAVPLPLQRRLASWDGFFGQGPPVHAIVQRGRKKPLSGFDVDEKLWERLAWPNGTKLVVTSYIPITAPPAPDRRTKWTPYRLMLAGAKVMFRKASRVMGWRDGLRVEIAARVVDGAIAVSIDLPSGVDIVEIDLASRAVRSRREWMRGAP